MIFIYQIVGAIAGLLAIILAILRFREGKMTIGMLSLWILIWIGVIYVSLDPGATNLFASFVGIGRGLDVVIILGLFGCYYLIFKIYTMIESMEQEITLLVMELALQREDTDKNIQNVEDKSQ